MSNDIRFVVIGEGHLATACLVALIRSRGAKVVLAVSDPRRGYGLSNLSNVAAASNVPFVASQNINDPSAIAMLTAAQPDIIVSANNFQILGRALLAIPSMAAINGHNGPLPRYAGMHACSWALLNGEVEHGFTWHVVERAIDAGQILAQRKFPVRNGMRAVELILKSVREGIALFSELVPRLVAGDLCGTPQAIEQRIYHGARDKPYEGRFPLDRPFEDIERLSRAIAFHPLPNDFVQPLLRSADQVFPVLAFSAVRCDETAAPGTILSIDDKKVTMAISGGSATLWQIRGPNGHSEPAAALFNRSEIKAGTRLHS